MPVLALLAIALAGAAPQFPTNRPPGGDIVMTNGTADAAAQITGTWRVTAVRDGAVPLPARIEMTFDAGRVSGLAGCSGFKATTAIKGDALNLGMISFAATECETEVMQASSDFIRALGLAVRYEIGADGRLTLYSGPVPVVFAERAKAAAD